jgi:putative transposase
MQTSHRRRSPRLWFYDYSQPGYYFVTPVTHDRQCVLAGQRAPTDLTPAGRMVDRCWRDLPSRFANVSLDEFVIMPNHLHGILIISPPADPSVSVPDIMRVFKSLTTREYLHGDPPLRRPEGPELLWQRSYHERVIRNDEHLASVREYIVNNPLAWELDRENVMRAGQAPPLRDPW